MSERAFLDFYDTLDKVPVNQQGAGSNYHFAQRTALYRTLGISPLMIQGRDILEIGPGSGDNALHLASWQPNAFSFIDGSKAAIKAINTRISQGCYGANAQVFYQDITKSPLEKSYDVIVCEGLIPGQQNPEEFLQRILLAVKPNGICVFTTVSATSYLAEICRRILLPTVKSLITENDDLTQVLVKLFQPGLNSLKGMTRKPEDWVMDNIIHNWTERGFFTIEDALQCLPENFSFLGSSPDFIQDWRWYKDSAGTSTDTVVKSYHQWSGYLLDYRSNPQQAFADGESMKLELLSQQAMVLHDHYRQHEDQQSLNEFLVVITNIAEHIKVCLPETSLAINDFIRGFAQLRQGNLAAEFNSFHTWFGRGQQYVSVIRE